VNKKSKRVAILTGGGDCPGLNAVIRGLVRRLKPENYTIIGLLDGWEGLLENKIIELDYPSVTGILHVGGTILGTSRTNVLKDEPTIQKAFDQFKKLQLDALVSIGGEGTLYVTNELFKRGMPVIGVPKTIDNDIFATDFTFGFNTAVEVATQALDRIHTTAESHRRVMVVEVMGRHAGWIAAYSGIASGADVILMPEHAMSFDDICANLQKRFVRGKKFSIIVVAEGAKFHKDGEEISVSKSRTDAFGRPQLGGIGQTLANMIEDSIGVESRVTVIGHVQRGGTPTAQDRILATQYASSAADLIIESKFGMMPALRGNQIVTIPLSEATAQLKTVTKEVQDLVKKFTE
jgi:ATP-dependent phosphofructokinase / diphosphate-dependent phosphofructokinase